MQRLNDIKPLHPLIQEIAHGSFRHKQPPAIEGSGWVVKSLEASLWAFHGADAFEEAVLRAVNLGDDADTTGAICGQLAGAFWGESQIPVSLRSGLARRDMLESAWRASLTQPAKPSEWRTEYDGSPKESPPPAHVTSGRGVAARTGASDKKSLTYRPPLLAKIYFNLSPYEETLPPLA